MLDDANSKVPPYGEQVYSWISVFDDLAPRDEYWTDEPYNNEDAHHEHRIRGLATSQASETEAVLGQILRVLDPLARLDRPAGSLLKVIRGKVPAGQADEVASQLDLIDRAIKRRNRLVHDPIVIHYSTNVCDCCWEPVLVTLGGVPVDRSELERDLAIQQYGTRAAVRVLLAVSRRSLTEQTDTAAGPVDGSREGMGEPL